MKTIRLLLFAFLYGFVTNVQSQAYLDWSSLSEGISWEPQQDIPVFRRAIFSSDITSLEGEEVVVVGYFLRLEGTQLVTLLSKNPMASCFFCGNGGPETIIELQFVDKPTFKMDDLLSVSGILRLNRTNPNHCYYKIENAVGISL